MTRSFYCCITSLPFIPFFDVRNFFKVHILSVHLFAASILIFAAARTLFTSAGSLALPARRILSYSFSSFRSSLYRINFTLRSSPQRDCLWRTKTFLDSSIIALILLIWSSVLSCSFFLSWAALLGKVQKKFALPILSLQKSCKLTLAR